MIATSGSFERAQEHYRAGRLASAEALCRRILAKEPRHAQSLHLLGMIADGAQRPEIAIALIGKAIALDGGVAAYHNSLAHAYRLSSRLDEAAASCRHALALDPGLADAHYNLGSVFYRRGDTTAAIESCRRAISLDPEHAKAHERCGAALLLSGDLAAGWPEYEWRWRDRDVASRPQRFAQPQWRGESLAGRRILLHAEQGLGDTLQFARYAPIVAARGGRVRLEVQPELRRLLTGLPGVEKLVASGESLPDFDLHCPLLSLPLAFGTELASIPASVPYLQAEPSEARNWAHRLAGPAPRIGLAWAGNPAFRWDATRSLRDLSMLASLAAVEGVCFYSLQIGPAAAQTKHPPAGMRLVDLSPQLQDFADTAAAISALDLVITTDTSVAHLAGALGRPVWILLQYVPAWTWLMLREDSPWYPTARLFRQRGPGAWLPEIERVASELARFAAGHHEVLIPGTG